MKNYNDKLSSMAEKIELVEDGQVRAILTAMTEQFKIAKADGTLLPVEIGNGSKLSHAVTLGQLKRDGSIVVAGGFDGANLPTSMGAGKVQYCTKTGTNFDEAQLVIEKDDGSFEAMTVTDGQSITFAIPITTSTAGHIKTGEDLSELSFKEDHIYNFDEAGIYRNNGAIGEAYNDTSVVKMLEIDLDQDLTPALALPTIPAGYEVHTSFIGVSSYDGTIPKNFAVKAGAVTIISANDFRAGKRDGAFQGETLFESFVADTPMVLENATIGGTPTAGNLKLRIPIFKKKVA